MTANILSRKITPELLFNDFVHVGRPNLPNCDILFKRFSEALDRHWLSNDGPLVREFEQKIADYVGVKHCIAMCNATIALEIAIRAAELKGEVIIPAYTFVATAHALQWQEITPVFCDIDPVTHNIDPAQIERLITPKTTAIIGVHIWGRPCDVQELQRIADKHNLKLMFDAAHAIGCSHHGKMIGSFGLAEVFSFHATKFVNSAEGGAVVTNNDELAKKIRLMRNFGFNGFDNVIYVGTNGKMNELSAAMGLCTFEMIDDLVEINQRNYRDYKQALSGINGLQLIDYNDAEKNNFQYIVLDLDRAIFPLSRDQIVQVLHAHNVLARRYFFPGVHRMEPYRSYYPLAELVLPVTNRIVENVIVLPTGSSVDSSTIQQIAAIIRWGCENAKELRNTLTQTVPPGNSFTETPL